MNRKSHETPDAEHDSPPGHPNANQQSGSTGRPTPDPARPGKDSGQGKYGQSGGKPAETDGQAQYRHSERNGDKRSKNDSNEGSGRADADETAKDIPKTG
jgi:hypothetical protein